MNTSLKHLMEQVRKDVYNGVLCKTNGQSYSLASQIHYNKVIKIIEPLLDDFDTANFEPSTDRKERLKIRGAMNRYVLKFRKRIRENGNESGTEENYVSVLKWVLGRINENYGINVDTSGPAWKRLNHKTSMLVPESKRIVAMIKNPPTLKTQDQRDAFRYITSCLLTTARYSDLSRWNQDNIITRGGNKYLRYVPHKSKNRAIEILVNPLLEKQFSTIGFLLPQIGYHRLRRAIKQVMEIAGWTEDIKQLRFVGEDEITKTKKAFELIGIHRFRASAITGMLENGLTETETKEFSGHVQNSKSFGRYVELSRNTKDKAINKYNSIFDGKD